MTNFTIKCESAGKEYETTFSLSKETTEADWNSFKDTLSMLLTQIAKK